MESSYSFIPSLKANFLTISLIFSAFPLSSFRTFGTKPNFYNLQLIMDEEIIGILLLKPFEGALITFRSLKTR